MTLRGVPASPGRAAGPVVRVGDAVVVAAERPSSGPRPPDLEAEVTRIRPAAELVGAQLSDRAALADDEVRAVLEMTALMAQDPSLLAKAEELVRDKGFPAVRAVWDAAEVFIDGLTSAGGYLAERVADLRDVRDRIIAELTGARATALPRLTTPSVLIARELAPADAAELDPALVLAVVTEQGGPTSHTAIMARSLGIPSVVGCPGVLELETEFLQVDGSTGEVEPFTEARVVVADKAPLPSWNGIGSTGDGARIALLANVGSAQDAADAAQSPAQGVGLFRTEFCYLAADSEPSVAEQREMYGSVLGPFHGKPIAVRTLDAGADKPLTFLLPDAEPNPALGVRGIRVAMRTSGLLERQLDAIVAAAEDTGARLAVMAPMVATVDEAEWFVSRARAAGVRSAGVMIEVPSAALTAAELFEVVDFVSIGTNDLAQYTMAADRELGTVGALQDPWQPALLRLVGMVGAAASAAGKPVGICGEAAADPLLACVFAGFGVSSLSMNSSALTAVGAELALHTSDSCHVAAQAAASTVSPQSARAAAHEILGN